MALLRGRLRVHPIFWGCVVLACVGISSCATNVGVQTYDWIAYGDGLEAGGAVTYSPSIPTNSSGVGPRSLVPWGLSMETDKMFLSGTVTNITAAGDVEAGPGEPRKMFVGSFSKGNTTQRLSWREFSSTELFGSSFGGGFIEDRTGRSAMGSSVLYVSGTVADSIGMDAFVLALSTTDLSLKWKKRVRNQARGGEIAKMGHIVTSGTQVCGCGEEAPASWPQDSRGFVFCLRTDTGAVAWFKQLFASRNEGDPIGDVFHALSFRPDGGLVVVGESWGDHSNGAGQRLSFGRADSVVLALDTSQTLTFVVHYSLAIPTALTAVVSSTAVDYFSGRLQSYAGNTMMSVVSQKHGLLAAEYTLMIDPTSPNGDSVHAHIRGISLVNNRLFVAGSSTSYFGDTNHGFVGPSEGMVAMVDRDNGEYMWFRYVGQEGRSSFNDLACEEGVCYAAGTFQPTGGEGNFFMIMRTPICNNGTHVPANIDFPTSVYSYDTCYECAAGNAQNISAQTSCEACLPGYYAHITKLGNCLACDPGTYSGTGSATSCVQCPLGYNAASSAMTNCTECPAGSYADGLGTAECKLCPAGTASAIKGATNANVCQPCAQGTYAPTPGHAQCLQCPNGHWTNETQATSCFACPVGHQLDALGATSFSQCTPCALGTIAPNTGTGQCAKCPGGTHQNQTAQTVCHTCPPRTMAKQEGSIHCEPCPPGTASDIPGTVKCALCPKGTYQDKFGQAKCKGCAVDTFAMYDGSITCTECPGESWTQDNVNSDHILMCKCKRTFYGSPGEGRHCAKCPAFASCASTDRYPNLPAGTWMRTNDLEKQFKCQPEIACPGGTPSSVPEPDPTNPIFPPGAQQPNFTTLATPDTLIGRLHSMASRHAGVMKIMSDTTYESACGVGYTGEACSSCSSGYYRSKGNCVACTGSSFAGSSAVIYTLTTLGLIVCAILLLVFGLWKGSLTLILEKQKAKLQRLLHSKDPEETVEELAALSHHGVVTTTDADGDTNLVYDSAKGAKAGAELSNARNLDSNEGSDGASEQEEEKKGIFKRIWGAITGVKDFIAGTIDAMISPFKLVVEERDMLTVLELERRGWSARLSSVIARLIKFAQLSSVLLNIKVEWPESLTTLGSALQVASFDINDIISVQCLSGSDAESTYATRYYFRIFLPIIFMGLSAVYAFHVYLISWSVRCMSWCAARSQKKAKRPAVSTGLDSNVPSMEGSEVGMVPDGAENSSVPMKRRGTVMHQAHAANVLNNERTGCLVDLNRSLSNSVDTFVMLFLLFGSLAYVTMHAAVIEVFTCMERDSGNYYLTSEPEIKCFVTDGTWMTLMPIGVIGFFFISLGVPALLAVFICTRHPRRHRKVVDVRYGFLWNAYRTEKYWFELVNIAFKFILVLMMPLSFLSSGDQLAGMMFVFIMYLMTQLVYLPFRVPSDNWMEAFLLASVLLLDILGIILYANASGSETEMTTFGRETLAYIAIISMIFVMLYFLYTAIGGQARTQGWMQSYKSKFAAQTIRERYEFVSSVCKLEQVVVSGEGEQTPFEGTQNIARKILMLPENTFWLGDVNMGRMMYIPVHYLDMWEAILRSKRDGRPVTVLAGPGGGKTFFGAFLVMMFAYRAGLGDDEGEEKEGGQESGAEEEVLNQEDRDTPSGAENDPVDSDLDDVYIGTLFYETPGGRILEFNLESVTIHIMSRKKFESRLRKRKARRESGSCAMICDGTAVARTIFPDECVLRIRLACPGDLSLGEWEDAIMAGRREDGDNTSPLIMGLTPWHPSDLLSWTNLRRQNDDPMEFVRTLRSYLVSGGRPPAVQSWSIADQRSSISAKVEQHGGIGALEEIVAAAERPDESSLEDQPCSAQARLVEALTSRFGSLVTFDDRVAPKDWRGAPMSCVCTSQEILTLLVAQGRQNGGRNLDLIARAARLDSSGWCVGLLRQLYAGLAVTRLAAGCRLQCRSMLTPKPDGAATLNSPPDTLKSTFKLSFRNPIRRAPTATTSAVNVSNMTQFNTEVRPMMRDPVIVSADGVFGTSMGSGDSVDEMDRLNISDSVMFHVFRRRDAPAMANGAVSVTESALMDGVLAFSVNVADSSVSIYKFANYSPTAGTPFIRSTVGEQIRSILRVVLGQWQRLLTAGGPQAGPKQEGRFMPRLWRKLTGSPKPSGGRAPGTLTMEAVSSIQDSPPPQAMKTRSLSIGSDVELLGNASPDLSSTSSNNPYAPSQSTLRSPSKKQFSLLPSRKKQTSSYISEAASEQSMSLPSVTLYHLVMDSESIIHLHDGDISFGPCSYTLSQVRGEDVVVPVEHVIAGIEGVFNDNISE